MTCIDDKKLINTTEIFDFYVSELLRTVNNKFLLGKLNKTLIVEYKSHYMKDIEINKYYTIITSTIIEVNDKLSMLNINGFLKQHTYKKNIGKLLFLL